MSTELKLTLSLVKKRDGSQIYYKIDGERFKENKTIKLHVDTEYKITMEFRPSQAIKTVSLSGIAVEGTSTQRDSTFSSYCGTWSTSMLHKTSKKVRTFLPLRVQFEDGTIIQKSLQCKLYPLNDKTHVVWGTPLKNIVVQCRLQDEVKMVTIEEISFV